MMKRVLGADRFGITAIQGYWREWAAVQCTVSHLRHVSY